MSKAYFFKKDQFKNQYIFLDSKKEEITVDKNKIKLDKNWKISSKKDLFSDKKEQIGLMPGKYNDFYRGYIIDYVNNKLISLKYNI